MRRGTDRHADGLTRNVANNGDKSTKLPVKTCSCDEVHSECSLPPSTRNMRLSPTVAAKLKPMKHAAVIAIAVGTMLHKTTDRLSSVSVEHVQRFGAAALHASTKLLYT